MSEMTDESAARWERIRAKGIARFILVQGFVGWGLMSALIWGLLIHFTQHVAVRDVVWMGAIIGVVGGLTSGVTQWVKGERRYKRWRLERTA